MNTVLCLDQILCVVIQFEDVQTNNRQTNRRTDKQTDRQTDGQTDLKQYTRDHSILRLKRLCFCNLLRPQQAEDTSASIRSTLQNLQKIYGYVQCYVRSIKQVLQNHSQIVISTVVLCRKFEWHHRKIPPTQNRHFHKQWRTDTGTHHPL